MRISDDRKFAAKERQTSSGYLILEEAGFGGAVGLVDGDAEFVSG